MSTRRVREPDQSDKSVRTSSCLRLQLKQASWLRSAGDNPGHSPAVPLLAAEHGWCGSSGQGSVAAPLAASMMALQPQCDDRRGVGAEVVAKSGVRPGQQEPDAVGAPPGESGQPMGCRSGTEPLDDSGLRKWSARTVRGSGREWPNEGSSPIWPGIVGQADEHELACVGRQPCPPQSAGAGARLRVHHALAHPRLTASARCYAAADMRDDRPGAGHPAQTPRQGT
jgi:hypothetical protein